jgi:hypothetical protein
MSHKRVTSFLTTAALLLLPQAFAQTRNRTESTGLRSADLTSAVDSLRKHSDKFEDKLGDVLDHSTYDHRARESLMRWADMVEDQVDSMAKELKADNTQQNNQQFIDHFESAMLAASAINRAMPRKDFSTKAESLWSGIREDLNHVAMQLHRPVLPNVTVVIINPINTTAMAGTSVKPIMERLESETDRFEDSLRKALRGSTVNMTNRQRVWNQWADLLEDSSDDMLKDYRHNDPAKFQNRLETTLMVGEALNRLVLRSDLGKDTNSEWRVVHDDLNTIATTFGYPVLTDPIYSR